MSRMRIATVVPAEHRVVFTGQSWEVLAKGHRYLVDNVRERLRELDVTLPSAREIRRQAGSRAGAEASRSISVTRTRDGKATVFQATETTTLEPGDIIDVKKLLPRELTYQGPSTSEPGLRPYQMGAAGSERPDALASR